MTTNLKSFIVETAQSLMAQMVGQAIANGTIDINDSFNANESIYDHLATQATKAAQKLGHELVTLGIQHKTDMFDGYNSTFAGIEDEIHNLSEILQKQYNTLIDEE